MKYKKLRAYLVVTFIVILASCSNDNKSTKNKIVNTSSSVQVTNFKSKFKVVDKQQNGQPIELRGDQVLDLSMELTNLSDEIWFHQGSKAFKVGIQAFLVNEGEQTLVGEFRNNLHSPLLPNQTILKNLSLGPFGVSLPVGKPIVFKFGMLQEGVTWAFHHGDKLNEIAVIIR